MQRREFITLLGGTVATWPFRARAQQAEKLPRVGFLGLERTTPVQIDLYRAFSSQLEKNGLREGQNIIVEYRPSTTRAAHLSVPPNCCVLNRICW
jgi:putative ABC transport system substrate-binding protein